MEQESRMSDLISRKAMINMCKEVIAQSWNHASAPESWAQAFATFLDLLETAPTLTADDYFDAVDRIKPCPNCRYTLLGALTEDEPRWIPVTERFPELIPCEKAGTAYSEAVIVWTTGKKAMIAVWDGIDFLCAADYWEAWGETITHWMPLPEPPKENEP